MKYIGAIDQGTTSSRFIIFNENAEIISTAQKEHTQYLPQPGYVEHDANEIWSNVSQVMNEALAKAGILFNQLHSIGITNQRETIVAWDRKSGDPLYHAIVWQDLRSQSILDELSEENKKYIVNKTGLTISPYFSASKMSWLLRNVPSIKNAGANLALGTIDTWLLYKLLQKEFTDVTNASRTMLMDLETLEWDQKLLDIFGIPSSALATICPSLKVFGRVNNEVPIAAVLGDQQSAMLGQLCFNRGDSKCTYGTGNFALVNTGNEIVRSKNGLLTSVCFQFENQKPFYALEGSVAVTGSAIQWLRDQLGIISHAFEIETLANSVNDSGDVYFVPAFSGLFAPYWRGDARGTIVGLTRASTNAHIARATLEAIAYQTKEVLNSCESDLGQEINAIKVDGGACANNLLMQIQSDISQCEVIRPEIIETTALGAAIGAGLATNLWNQEEINFWKVSRKWSPEITIENAEKGFIKWKKAIERSLCWA